MAAPGTLKACLLLPFLAACASPTTTPRAPQISLTPDANGLAVAPSGLRIDFGRSPKGVVPSLDRTLGRHTALPLTGCPADIRQNLRWGDLILTFTKERFVGWRQQGQSAGRTCAE